MGQSGQNVATRRLLGVLIAMWLNMALQPCAMAAEADHDCPHCPPAHHEQMAGHHGGHHGKAEKQPPCAAFEAQCGDLGDISFETRETGSLPDLEQPEVAAAESHPQQAGVAAQIVFRATGPPHPGPPPSRLYVLNCAYLK